MDFEHMYDMSYEEASQYGRPISEYPKKVDMGELLLQEDGTYSAAH